MIRTAGIHARTEGGVSKFCNAILQSVNPTERSRLRTIVFPTERPLIGAIVADIENVQCATRSDGSFAIVDGEIYDLGTESFISLGRHNVAEMVLDHYCSGGRNFLSKINSAAVITIWDATQGALLMSRDRFGCTPAFFSEQSDGLLWASHISTLLEAGVPRSINLAAVDFFLGTGFVLSPWTLIREVQKIPCGQFLTSFRDGSIRLRRHWSATGQPKLKLTEEQSAEQLGKLFRKALARRCSVSERTGVLLSGGVDSQLIVGALVRWLGFPADAIDTFTFTYGDYDGEYNEGESARRCAAHFGVRHYEISYGPKDLMDNLERMISVFGEPFTYGTHSLILDDVVGAGVSGLQSGAGPDGWYLEKWEHRGRVYARLPTVVQAVGRHSASVVRKLSGAIPIGEASSWRRLAQGAARRLEETAWCAATGLPWHCSPHIVRDPLRTELYDDASWVPEARHFTANLLSSALALPCEESERDRITIAHMRSFTADSILSWNHWIGQAHGLTIRTPYLDNDLIEFVLHLPRYNRSKAELRRLAATVLPSEMAYQPKLAQTIPIQSWLRGPLKDYLMEQLSPDVLRAQGLFDSKAVRQMVDEHLHGRADHHWRLWVILSLTIWIRCVLKPTARMR